MIDCGNYEEMARQLVRLAEDDQLRKRLSENIRELAWRVWSPRHLRESLSQVFWEELTDVTLQRTNPAVRLLNMLRLSLGRQ